MQPIHLIFCLEIMLRPAYLFALLFFFCQSVFAQKGNRMITITPALLPMGTIAVQPGFQFRINKKFSLLSEIAIPVAKNTQGDINEFSCYRVSSELKYYRKRSIRGRFIGFQLGFTYRKFADLDSGSYWGQSYSKTSTGYSSAKIKSPLYFFNLKFGREIRHWDKLYLDYFLTIGLRFIPTKFDAKGEYSIYDPYARRGTCMPFSNWDPAWENPGNYWRPNAGVGIRLGWKL
jgi:hypothetical protein